MLTTNKRADEFPAGTEIVWFDDESAQLNRYSMCYTGIVVGRRDFEHAVVVLDVITTNGVCSVYADIHYDDLYYR